MNERFGAGIRPKFPIFSRTKIDPLGKSQALHYLDSGASAQKPAVVIDRLSHYLQSEHANIHRGAYELSAESTAHYDRARTRVAQFVNAATDKSIIFTRGTTEAVNLVARSLEQWFQPGDCILLSLLEHHSNIVPWQLLAQRRGLAIQFIDIHSDGSLDLVDFKKKLQQYKPKLLSITQLANSLGTIVPVAELCAEAKRAGTKVMIDAAQSIVHGIVDVQAIGCDFLAFSGHKIYGPMGIGVLYVEPAMYQHLQPFQGGGDMIEQVTINGSTWAEPPAKFEAGTPAIGEAIALGAALDFVDSLGRKAIADYEAALFQKAWQLLAKEERVTLYGPATANKPQASIISFNVQGVHPHDLSTIVDSFNVQIRAGHHCAMPTLKRLGIPSSARASIGMYTQLEDFEMLIEAIRYAQKMFA